jgi:TatD DNase family protein
MLIDAHAHFDKYPDEDIEEVLAALEERRIMTLSVSVDPSSYARTRTIATRSPLVVPGFGIHPEQAPAFVDSLTTVEGSASRAPMIGEIGLDHRFVIDTAQYNPQEVVFGALLDLAKAQGKLVNLHCLGAEQRTLDMLESRGIERAIIHWYAGPLNVLSKMIVAGYTLTIGVAVLYSSHIRQIARTIPSDQLLTETDNPGGLRWLTDEIGRPPHLDDVIAALAGLRGTTRQELIATVSDNWAALLQGDPHLTSWKPETVEN